MVRVAVVMLSCYHTQSDATSIGEVPAFPGGDAPSGMDGDAAIVIAIMKSTKPCRSMHGKNESREAVMDALASESR